MKKLITSESVNIGHPDKTCDTIADAFLDEALRQDPNAMMAIECAIKNNKLFIYGECTTTAKIEYESIAKTILKDIGYKEDFEIIKEISCQSPDINQAVVGKELRANDQGIVYGYATNETKEFMPLPIVIAHKLMKKYEYYRRTTNCYYSDAKSEVTISYEDEVPESIAIILVSVSHSEKLTNEQIREDIMKNVVNPVLEEYKEYNKGDIHFLINTSGRFTIWGSYGDSGCVGRKIIVDTYGGVGRIGGGCFSSKNATKVDRSGAYYARYIAKNIVAYDLADKCEIQFGYAIGISRPISMYIDTFGTNKVSMEKIYSFVAQNFDCTLSNIISELDLLRPIYQQTACYGHFGRNEFPWEQIKLIK